MTVAWPDRRMLTGLKGSAGQVYDGPDRRVVKAQDKCLTPKPQAGDRAGRSGPVRSSF